MNTVYFMIESSAMEHLYYRIAPKLQFNKLLHDNWPFANIHKTSNTGN